MLVMVVAGYRLSWSCMQLAYVSNGSFIFQDGRSLSDVPRPEGRKPKPRGQRGPTTAAMPEEDFGNIIMVYCL